MSRSKRLFDLFWTLLGLALLWPLLAAVALLVKAHDGGPVFFRQVRVGYRGRTFRVWKFRTMRLDAARGAGGGGMALTVAGDARVTRIGRWLRTLKVDELPQLFNVLSGDMSLVGPRPEVPRFVALYTTAQREVLNFVPGLTDAASIRYRNESDMLGGPVDPEPAYVDSIMPEKIRLSLAYAAQATIWTDFLVICTTLRQVFRMPMSAAQHAAPLRRRLPPDGAGEAQSVDRRLIS